MDKEKAAVYFTRGDKCVVWTIIVLVTLIFSVILMANSHRLLKHLETATQAQTGVAENRDTCGEE